MKVSFNLSFLPAGTPLSTTGGGGVVS